jgi:hypothetical protein
MIPNTVTSIGNNTFVGCYSLAFVTIPNTITSISDSTFVGCLSLTSIMIPSGVTSIDNNAFQDCSSLACIMIPSTVTSINSFAFQKCSSLTSITIPDGVTSIGNSTFINCYGLGLIDILSIFVPTVSNANAWLNIPADCIIFIPYEIPSVYLTANNYPDPANYTYMGYDTFESGVTLPIVSEDMLYNYTWYATLDDAKAQTNPISVGTGNKIYCRFTAA